MEMKIKVVECSPLRENKSQELEVIARMRLVRIRNRTAKLRCP